MLESFEILGLQPELVQAIENLGYEQPTPIQEQAIPALMAGQDVLGQAQTGTGKTAAFALPMLQTLLPGKHGVQALVLAPTRELAIQVADATKTMARHLSIKVLPVYGGQSYTIQTRALERGVDVVAGTPGRLLDLVRQGVLDLSSVRYLVVDEADEMLEMGFIEDVEAILALMPAERQMALFSATLPQPVRELASRYMHDPQQIMIAAAQMTVAETEQRYYRVREENKLPALTRILAMEDVKSALIFARTKARSQELADELARQGYPAAPLHGDLNQSRREYVLNQFRTRTVILLVATDVAARGLDIEDVSHVINFDLPHDGEDYVHRIGRTGRAGRKGVAISFITPKEQRRLREIETYTRQRVSEFTIPSAEAVQAHRDDRFVERLTAQFEQTDLTREQAMVAKLVQSGADLAQVAAAALKLARGSEAELPGGELNEPAKRTRAERAERPTRREYSNEKPNRERSNERRSERREEHSDATAYRSRRNDKRSQEPGMVRLWMNLGNTHGLRPGDVVGAIAGESGIPGRAIGGIDIRKNYTLLDVSEQHVSKVLQATRKQYQLRGQTVTVRLDDGRP